MNDARSPSSTLSGPAASRLRLPAIVDPPSETNPPKEQVWIVFGATGHMGRSLVRTALSHGDKVTAVGHTFENSMAQMQGWHEHCYGLLCDVRIRETVDAVIQDSIEHWGRIDIIANCTGYGVVAAAEDQSDYDLLNQFATNFTGTLHILQLSLPYFRINNIPGRYLIFSSTSGALGVPGLAPYCASKYAVEGLIESMLYETDCFNIKATLVEPGYVRLDDTDAARPMSASAQTPPTASIKPQPQDLQSQAHQAAEGTQTSTQAPPGEQLKRYGHFVIKPNPSPPYDTLTSPAGHAKRIFLWFDSRQPTSSVRSAELVWQLGHCSYPPLRLLLGSYAVESIRDRLRSVIEEIEDWKWLSFPAEGDEADRDEKSGVGGSRGQRNQGATGDRTSHSGEDHEEQQDDDGDEDDHDDDEHNGDEDGEAQDDMMDED